MTRAADAAAAAAAVAGRTVEDVLRELASRKGADPMIVALVARFDAKRARREAKAAADE